MIKKLPKDKCLYVMLGIVTLFLFILVREPFGDDFYYLDQKVHDFGTWRDFLVVRYTGWSSRLFSETVILLLLNLGMAVWRIFVVVNIVAVALSVKYLSGIGDSVWQNAVLCMLAVSFPVSYHVSAGWITTTSVYLLSVSLGLIAMFPLRKQLSGIVVPWWENVLCIIAAVGACNHEQMCAILLGVYLCSCIFCVLDKRRIRWIQVCMIAICILSVIFILSCPGNTARTVVETKNWLPEYADWTVSEKIWRGILHAADYFFYTKNINFVCLTLVFVMTTLVIQNVKNIWKKMMAVAGAIWVCAAMGIILLQRSHFIGEETMFRWGECGENVLSTKGDILRAASAIFLLVLLVMELYWLLGKNVDFLIALMILAAGFGSAAVVCFSPTIYASGNRVFTFFLYAVFLLISYLLKKLCPNDVGREEMIILLIVVFFTFGAFAKNILVLRSIYLG